jgi:hypothetical protein
MSTPTDRLHDPNSASFCAPTGARTVRLGQVSEAASALAATLPPHEPHGAGKPFEQPGAPIRRPRRSLDPEFPPAPPPRLRKRSWPAAVGRAVLIVSTAAVVALIAVGQFPFPGLWRQPAQDRAIELAASSSRPVSSTAAERPVFPRLIVQDARGNGGDPAPLGVALQGPAAGATVMITGLVAGMTLSTGGAVGAGAWQVSVTDLANTWIHPPKNFVGSTELVAELRLADNTIAHRRPIRLEWMPPPAAPAHHQLDREEIAVLLERGKALLANGDLAAARLVLLPAAEASDAEAALALAATYDPFVLRELTVHGFSADAAMARAWYEKASELGSAEAPRRLGVLANGAR